MGTPPGSVTLSHEANKPIILLPEVAQVPSSLRKERSRAASLWLWVVDM